MEPFQAKIVAAATGSTLTALTMTPFDVVKTRMQTQRPPSMPSPSVLRSLSTNPNACCQPGNVPCVRLMSTFAAARHNVVCVWEQGVLRTEPVNGFFDAFRHVWRAEGVRGLWKGAGTSLLMGVPSATCYMLTYDYLLNTAFPPLLPANVLLPLTSGIVARATISSLVSPLELVRTNLQSTPINPGVPHTLRSTLRLIGSMVQQSGFRALWSGLGPTLWRDVPFSGLYWAGYDISKRKLKSWTHDGKDQTWIAFVSGAGSGITAALITHPFDVMKTRRQAIVMAPLENRVAFGSLGAGLEVVRIEGAAALFAGVFPRLVKIAPACGIMIASFEGVGRFLGKLET